MGDAHPIAWNLPRPTIPAQKSEDERREKVRVADQPRTWVRRVTRRFSVRSRNATVSVGPGLIHAGVLRKPNRLMQV